MSSTFDLLQQLDVAVPRTTTPSNLNAPLSTIAYSRVSNDNAREEETVLDTATR